MNKERIELVPDTAKCSGCGACMAACPRQAIAMQEGQYGCMYPVIDEAACIRCGQCLRICPYHAPENPTVPQAAFAAAGTEEEVVRNSASGGIFAMLALDWISKGGLVAGAVMDCAEGVQVYHVLSGKAEDVARMQGSKYVQSDAWRCYGEVMAALREGKQVLFSGTPCQIAAIRQLTGNPEHLTTIDLICHGVPPVKMLDEYVRLLGRRFRGQISGFTFRDKSVRRDFCARIDVQRGRKRSYYLRSSILSFYKHFLTGTFYRENCYSCPYARLERVSDLTIGDYWGIETWHAQDVRNGKMPVRKDWSCVLVNTEKGQQLLDVHGGALALYASKAEWAAQENHQLRRPSARPAEREALLARYEQGGYAAVEEDFMRQCGGKLRYHVRFLRQLRQNARARREDKGSGT